MKTEGWDTEICLEGWNNGPERKRYVRNLKKRRWRGYLYICIDFFSLDKFIISDFVERAFFKTEY